MDRIEKTIVDDPRKLRHGGRWHARSRFEQRSIGPLRLDRRENRTRRSRSPRRASVNSVFAHQRSTGLCRTRLVPRSSTAAPFTTWPRRLINSEAYQLDALRADVNQHAAKTRWSMRSTAVSRGRRSHFVPDLETHIGGVAHFGHDEGMDIDCPHTTGDGVQVFSFCADAMALHGTS